MSESNVAFIFLYDGNKLTKTITDILNEIKDDEVISKIALPSDHPQLTQNTKHIVIKPEELPVFLIAKTGEQTKVLPGTIESAKKVKGVVQLMFSSK